METSRYADLKPRILVIHNDVTTLRRMESALFGQYEVHAASSVSLALLLLKEYRYAAILTSLALPNRFHGLNIVRFIKAAPACKRVPIIGLNLQQAALYDPAACEELDGWLEDTFEPDAVRLTVGKLLAPSYAALA